MKGIHDNATIYWPLYPEKLRQMFTKAFTVGLTQPSKRITEPEWMTLFSNMMSGMLQCSCGAQFFYDEDLEAKGVAHTCWNCGKAVQVPNKITIGKNQVLLNQSTKLLHRHVYDDFDMDTVVGSVVQNPKNPALWGIRNEDNVNWTYQKADGTQIPVARKNSWDCKRCKDYISCNQQGSSDNPLKENGKWCQMHKMQKRLIKQQ